MTPTGVRLKKTERILELDWADRGTIRIGTHALRCDCRCAACVDENTGIRILDVDAVPKDIGVGQLRLVGNYALKLTFTDGHDNGLFTWEHLRDLAAKP